MDGYIKEEATRTANNLHIMRADNDQTADQSSEGVQLIHPRAPELGHLRLSLEKDEIVKWASYRRQIVGDTDNSDTTEQTEQDEEERVDDSSNWNARSKSSDALTQGD